MKTTVDIADALLEEIRGLAREQGTTVRALIEEGLRRVAADRRRGGETFRLRRASFRGEGLQPGVRDGGWERLRDLAYEGRGG